MANNIINEADFLRSLENRDVQEIEKPPIVAGTPSGQMTPPPNNLHTVPPMLSGSLPAGMQAPHELARTTPPGVPSVRLWPIAPAGLPSNNSSVLSGTRGISNTANQASKTATSANTTAKSASAAVTVVSSTPVLQTTGVGGAIQSKPIVGGSPTAVNQDSLVDGTSFVRLAITHAAGNVSYNFKGAWSSATNYVVADEVTFNNIYWIALVNNLNSQPAIGNANWQAVGRIEGDIQIFTSSGTWSKPAAGTFAVVTLVGAGGGGSSGNKGTVGGPGGGGGGVSTALFPLSILGSTETVTVGVGATGGASTTGTIPNNGLDGGDSQFGNWLLAGGGKGGVNPNGGSGGVGTQGTGGAGANTSSGVGINGNVSSGGTMGAGGGASGGAGNNHGGVGGQGSVTHGSSLTGGAAGSDVIGANSNPGGSGTGAASNEPIGGPGGGGGGGNGGAFLCGSGGSPANYGGGGGGGGCGSLTTGSGAGGNGASGIVIISVY